MVGHGGLLRAFSFACPVRGSGHVKGIYPQTCPDRRRRSDSPQTNNRKDYSLWVTPFISRK